MNGKPGNLIEFRELFCRNRPGLGIRILRILLRAASPVYWFGAQVKNWLYDWGWKTPFKSPLVVISVGNLSVGGTGKSPVVQWIATQLRSKHRRVAVLSRGYGQLDQGRNDEALEMELSLPDVPHLQHWDRVVSAELARSELDMQILVLDDGFQHRRIARDLDIVLLDATAPDAARHVLPGGLLRESLGNLRRADVVMLTRVDQAADRNVETLRRLVSRHASQATLVETSHRPDCIQFFPEGVCPASDLNGRDVLAFCGIGNPESFFRTLEGLGATVLDRRTWPDHHAYSEKDVRSIEQWCAGMPDAPWLICTMKDWVKLQVAHLGGCKLGALKIGLHFERGEEAFRNRIASAVGELE